MPECLILILLWLSFYSSNLAESFENVLYILGVVHNINLHAEGRRAREVHMKTQDA